MLLGSADVWPQSAVWTHHNTRLRLSLDSSSCSLPRAPHWAHKPGIRQLVLYLFHHQLISRNFPFLKKYQKKSPIYYMHIHSDLFPHWNQHRAFKIQYRGPQTWLLETFWLSTLTSWDIPSNIPQALCLASPPPWPQQWSPAKKSGWVMGHYTLLLLQSTSCHNICITPAPIPGLTISPSQILL